MLPGTRQNKIWFFQLVTPAVRLTTYSKPNQATYQNLVSSAAFILNSEDSADAAQTQQGLVLKSVAADILAASDTKDIGFGALALSVSPKQLPTVALASGTVVVSQDGTTGALIYTLPQYLLASDGDVTITSPASGQILNYNGSEWVNADIYYQVVWSNLTPATLEPAINFSTTFGVTDDGTNHCTTITIAANAITYALMQHTSGGHVLLGNSTGSAGAISEQTVGAELTLSTGSLTITTNGVTYAKIQQASTGYVLLGNATNAAANYAEVIISARLAFTGGNTLDIAVNGITYDKFQQASTGKVLLGNSTSGAANYAEIAVAGMQLANGVLAANGIKNVNTATYQVIATDFNGLILLFSYSSTGAVTVTLCNPATLTPGLKLSLKDISGAANTHNITINPYGSETIDGATSLVISTAYGNKHVFCDGVNWYSI